ncbi:MAG: YolD-like family protein [Bacilli bacterium]|nr:YolD-like family protein [Bacilli bacterium]
MSDRGIKKWAPYKSLVEQDYSLKEQKEKDNRIEKPTISNEQAEEINDILLNHNGNPLKICYYRRGQLLEVVDSIKKIDPYERKIYLVSKKVILLSEICSIEYI